MNATEDQPLSILVIRLGALGDVANTIRAVAALRKEEPDARITWLVEAGSRDLVEASGVAEEVLLFPRKEFSSLLKRPWRWGAFLGKWFKFRRSLRQRQFTIVLDFQGNLKSGLLSAATGARERVGFGHGHCREMNWVFNTILAMPASKRLHRAEKFAALAQVIAPCMQLDAVDIPENVDAAKPVEELIARVSGDGPLVVVHPGTSAFGEFKRWPSERYGEVIETLRKRHDARCIVTCGPGEEGLAAEVVAASAGAGMAPPVLPMKTLMELLRRADVVVAGDTGPLHIAALLRRRVVAIFGPKDPVIYAPYGTRAEIVRVDLPCSPCTKRKCPRPRCMTEIPPAAVLEATERLLAE